MGAFGESACLLITRTLEEKLCTISPRSIRYGSHEWICYTGDTSLSLEEQVSLISPEEVSQQIQYEQVPPDWTIFRPPKYPRVLLIMYGICYLAFWPFICTLGFSLVFWLWIQPDLVQSSPWPMYTTYPFLAVIAVALPLFSIWLVWWLEKRDRDTLLALLPSGLIHYQPWSDEGKRRATVIEYAQVQAITCHRKRAGIVLTITGKDRDRKRVFITRKYGSTSRWAMVHEDIAQQIINSQRRFSESQTFPTQSSLERA